MPIMNLAATCAVALALATPARAGQLLSIQGFRLPQKLHIDTLDLTIPDAHVLAYCHIPDGWILTTKQTPEKALTLSGGGRGPSPNWRAATLRNSKTSCCSMTRRSISPNCTAS